MKLQYKLTIQWLGSVTTVVNIIQLTWVNNIKLLLNLIPYYSLYSSENTTGIGFLQPRWILMVDLPKCDSLHCLTGVLLRGLKKAVGKDVSSKSGDVRVL